MRVCYLIWQLLPIKFIIFMWYDCALIKVLSTNQIKFQDASNQSDCDKPSFYCGFLVYVLIISFAIYLFTACSVLIAGDDDGTIWVYNLCQVIQHGNFVKHDSYNDVIQCEVSQFFLPKVMETQFGWAQRCLITPLPNIGQAYFTDWMSFLPSNLMKESGSPQCEYLTPFIGMIKV